MRMSARVTITVTGKFYANKTKKRWFREGKAMI